MWRPLALSSEKVTRATGLVSLLRFAGTTAHQTNMLLPVLVDENIDYGKLKLMYGKPNQCWNVRA